MVDWLRIGCSAPTPSECGESGGAAQFVFEEAEEREETWRRERLLLREPGRWGFVGACVRHQWLVLLGFLRSFRLMRSSLRRRVVWMFFC